jgi:hypothetical protein
MDSPREAITASETVTFLRTGPRADFLVRLWFNVQQIPALVLSVLRKSKKRGHGENETVITRS